MATYDLSLDGGRGGAPRRCADIGVRDGHITALADGGLDAAERLDVSGLTVFPGVIDQHFHTFRGFGWETHHNGTRAAAKGGITTAVDIPLEDPPFLSGAVLREKLAAIDGECHVDYACFGGYLASDPNEITRIADAGVAAYKLFTGGWRHRACIRVWTTASRSTRCGAPPRLVCPRPFSARSRTSWRTRRRGSGGGRDRILGLGCGAAVVRRSGSGPVDRTARTTTRGGRTRSRGPRELAGDDRRDRRRAAPGRRRVGGDLPPLSVRQPRRHGRRHAPEVEPAQPQARVRGPALGRPTGRTHPLRRIRPRAVPQGPQSGSGSRTPAQETAAS